ncbi:MAG: AAA family ATPase, partial [Anaerolineales bacterium]|nr:AAA family ATPase [Anaerolineales bacterium]
MHRLIPDFILHRYEQSETTDSFPAVCLLVDISGFTPLTNALVDHGIQGAEILADLLAAVFNPLVTIVHQQNGFIANFVGDAFKAIFPLQDNTTYQRALTAACRIRDHISQHNRFDTPFGSFSFAVKLAIADGSVEWGIWRYENPTAAQQAVYYFEGEGLAACLAADSIAQAGDLVITQAVYNHLQPLLPKSRLVANDHWQAGDVSAAHWLPPLNTAPASTEIDPAATAFYPLELLQSRTRGEFRQVVTVFINLQTIPEADTFAPLFLKLLEEYGGYLGRMGRIGSQDQGTTLLLLWGAPHSFENNIARALQFTLALQSGTTVPFKVGITHHLAFAGFVGSPEREEYTCYGSYVNQAARQMSAADWGEIWLDAETAIQAEAAFRVVYNGTIPLKGFDRPQPIYQLVGQYASTDNLLYTTSTMFGREQEFNTLLAAIQPLLDGRFGGLITIRGEAGIGKSRLLNEFFQAEFVTTHTQIFICQTDEILRQSLNPFIYWLRRYFDQSAAASKIENKNRFQNKFNPLVAQTAAALQPELERVHSFLGALLGLRWPNSLYEQVESKLRFDNTLQAIVTLLKAASEQRPVILVLEDVHWLDPDSQQLIEMILRQTDHFPLMLLATTRPAESDVAWISLPAPIPQTTIELQALPNEVLNELAQMLLNGPITADLLAIMTHRAEGNPFFVEQLLLYLQEQRLLRKQEGVWTIRDHDHLQSTLPRDVRAVLVARLDRLTNEVKQVVQTAAVLGREFSVRVLMQMLREDEL